MARSTPRPRAKDDGARSRPCLVPQMARYLSPTARFSGFQDVEMAQDLFFSRNQMDPKNVQRTVDQALDGADDGELFLEYSQSESFSYDDNRLKAASFDTSQGFGLRAVAGEATGYAHSTELSEEAIQRAARTVKAGSTGHSGTAAEGPARSNVKLY